MIRQVLLFFIFSLLTINHAHSVGGCESTLDRQTITELVAEYAYRWDRKDAVGFSELFASDGTIDWVLGKNPEGTPIKGRANILAYARKAYSERLAGRQSRHYFTNLIFEELDDDHATTKHMVFVAHQLPGRKPENVATGYYRIVWAKEKEKWLIAHRTLYIDR